MQSINDIMTREVVTVTEATSVREMAKIFETRRFGTLPVVDAEGRLLGIVTASDLIEQGRPLHMPTVIQIFDWVIPIQGEAALQRDLDKITAQTAGELCTREVVTVRPTDSISTAAELMSTHKLHSLPVTDGSRLVGIVARIDVIRSLNANGA